MFSEFQRVRAKSTGSSVAWRLACSQLYLFSLLVTVVSVVCAYVTPTLQRTDQQFSIYISYLEIYNEVGYDLLDPSQDTKTLEELPYVVRSQRTVTLVALVCDFLLATPLVQKSHADGGRHGQRALEEPVPPPRS